jgi:hypothetical protein
VVVGEEAAWPAWDLSSTCLSRFLATGSRARSCRPSPSWSTNDIVRIIDVAFIKKDASGNTTMFEYDVLDDVLAFGFADVDGEAGGVLNDEDLQLAAEGLEPDSSAALIVWEHRWAGRVARRSAMRAGASSPASGYRTRSWRRRWQTSRPADHDPRQPLRRSQPCCYAQPCVRAVRA